MKKLLLLLSLLLLNMFVLFSQESETPSDTSDTDVQNKKEEETDGFEEVEGLDQWTYTFDVSDLEEGVYNIIIKGEDNTGNVTYSSPININIDPDSDLPIAHIANPESDVRVGGNLNILGTCVDDDAVQYVEIKVDDQPYARAEGADFWSYFLDTSEMEDGYYTLTVRGTDINGVTGHEYSTGFNLDRQNPVNAVESHLNGALVHGKVTIEGMISDKNGIDSLSYSYDGIAFLPLKINYNKKDGTTSFSLGLNTKDQEDGAQILWLKSRDKMGSIGLSAFLYFVDNKAPDVTLLDPSEEDTDLNGKFSITGSIYDEVGVTELRWEADGESGEIELIPGNPYWSQEFDFTGENKAKVTIIATDNTGNVAEDKIELELNIQADLPVTSIRFPQADIITPSRRVEGFALDDDSIQSIRYVLDKREEVSLETTGPFGFDLPEDLAAGEHTIKIKAVDENGLIGPVAEQTFFYSRKAPVIRILSVIDRQGNETPYTPGMEIDVWKHQYLTGEVDYLNPSLTHSVSGPSIEERPLINSNKSGLLGPQPFRLDISSLPPGFISLKMNAGDEYQFESQLSAFLTVEDWTEVKGEDGIYLPQTEGNRYIITPENPLRGRVISLDLTNIDIEGGESAGFKFDLKENQFTLTPKEGGVLENIRLYMENSAGQSMNSQTLTLISDTAPPRISQLKSEISGGNVIISGKVTEEAALDFATITIGEESKNLQLDSEGAFRATYPLGNLPKGMPMAVVHVQDYAGNAALDQVVVKNLSSFNPSPEEKVPAPQIMITWPRADSTIYLTNNVKLSGEVLNTNDVKSISATVNDQVVEAQLDRTGFTLNLGGLSAGSHKISVTGLNSLDKTIKGSSVSFTVVVPKSNLRPATWQDGTTGFENSMALARQDEMALILDIGADSYCKDIQYKFNGGDLLAASKNKTGQMVLKLPENIPFMRNDLEIQFTDYQGKTRKQYYFFYILDPRDVKPVESTPGFRFTDRAISSNTKEIVLSPTKTLTGYFFGRPLESIELISESDLPTLNQKGRTVVLGCNGSGKAENVEIKALTVDGEEFSFGPFTLISDDKSPEINVEIEGSPWWLQNDLTLKGKIDDTLSITRLTYRLGENGNPITLQWQEDEEGNLSFEQAVSLSTLEDGPHLITVEAQDEAGNIGVSSFQIVKDTALPEITQITPAPDSTVNGRIMFYVKGSDDRGLSTMEFARDGENFELLSNPVIGGYEVDFTLEETLPDNLLFRATDRSGNQTLFSPNFTLDTEADKPRVFIQLPLKDTVVRTDFVVSGMAFDDDGIGSLFWRLDDEEFKEIEGKNNFDITVLLKDITDNEHVVEVKAVDLWGTESDVASMDFMVSKAAPVSTMLSPSIEVTNRGMIRITGESSDANGIKEIYVSQDNGNSFTLATGQEEWWYDIQSEYLPDGTHSLLIKAVDNTGHEGLYSSLINVDNTAPMIELTALPDGYSEPSELLLQGRAWDSVYLDRLYLEISPVLSETASLVSPAGDETENGEAALMDETIESLPRNTQLGEIVIAKEMPIDGLFRVPIAIKDLEPGWYNLKLTAVDRSANQTFLTRNFRKTDQAALRQVEISFPLEGEKTNHGLTIQGRVIAEEFPEQITLFVNQRRLDTVEVKPNGFFSYLAPVETLQSGPMEITAETQFSDGEVISSSVRHIDFSVNGPWIQIENYLAGDFLRDRPWISGSAGYIVPQEDWDAIADNKEAIKALEASTKIDNIQISLDNGKSFQKVSGKESWKYRIETGLMQDGQIPVLVRARFTDGSVAVSKTILIVDETPPVVTLLSPEEGMRFNESIELEGGASDFYGLDKVSVSLRKGDKSRYQIPSFIQGLYLDMHVFGAGYAEAGVGLTFFDDNVKLQGTVGLAPEGSRFEGLIISGKLIANIAVLPMGYFLGPSWDFYSMSFAVGANFTWYSMGDSGNTPVFVGAVLAQWEAAHIETEWKTVTGFGFYIEPQLWFISSDVQAEATPVVSLGIRTYFF